MLDQKTAVLETVPNGTGKIEPPASVPWARMKIRHHIVFLSFLLLFLFPSTAANVYIAAYSADQYHSTTAFSVRSEEASNPLDILGTFTQVGTSSASDSDILFEFIQSQPLIEKLNEELELEKIYNRVPQDFVFSLRQNKSIEDLTWYWSWMVSVSIGSTTGLIEVETRAFDPDDAQRIAKAILEESAKLINDLSLIARNDTTKFAREDLETAENRLKNIRLKIREFRNVNQIIDPEAGAVSQLGLLSALEIQLAEALVEYEILETYTEASDPRRVRGQRRIEAIQHQIDQEKSNISEDGSGAEQRPLSDVIGEYEELLVDLEFSQAAYVSALAAYEQAKAEARRQSRYLAVHVPPTISEEPQYPQRLVLGFLVTAFLFAIWAVVILIGYNVRDRR
ncbi:hypothetical protein ACFFUT_14385 [Pseudohalocynthiibacter aestuariivivens]|uniref:Sugar transporter n=1 Tax=Pseudohalocynthiibacter aestuariivivens TaxID=1591409 RepID=A0ABV5JHN0_9RHOB|nr:hypothetical protein [Pseudohalocynthiibacter aestuariivivens]MBS9715324.1 hypothetical protein [Pseudohalocynthiibacter aestuariivivens]